MFNREALRQAAAPAAFLLITSIACSLIFGYDIGIVAIAIQEFLAYLFGYFLVIRPRRSCALLWCIYVISFLLLNIGSIAERLGWMV